MSMENRRRHRKGGPIEFPRPTGRALRRASPFQAYVVVAQVLR